MLDEFFAEPTVLSYNRTPVTDLNQVLQDALLATAVYFVGQGLTTLMVKRKWPDMKDPFGTADTLFALVYFPPVVYLACHGAWELGESVSLRWHGTSPRAYWFHVWYVARCLAHIVFMPLMVMKRHQLYMTIGHHILSTIAYGGVLYTSRLAFFGCFDGVCEITNIFLTILYVYKVPELGLDSKDMLYQVNGFFLWLGFVVFRLMLFPYWGWIMYSDATTVPAETVQKVSTFEIIFYPFVTCVLMGLSILWMIPITKGIINIVIKGKKDTWSGAHGIAKKPQKGE